MDAGAYQYHMDPTLTIDNKYQSGQFAMKPAPVASDIINFDGRSNIVSPALCLYSNIDGTNMPSYQSHNEMKVHKDSFSL